MSLRIPILLAVALVLGQGPTASSNGTGAELDYRSVTTRLPAVDRVELLVLHMDGQYLLGFKQAKAFGGREARKIATLWRSLPVSGPSPSACHIPAYGIRFYSGGRPVVVATICWKCNNLAFKEPLVSSWIGFEGESRKGRELLQVFRDTFPGDTDASKMPGDT